VPNVVSENQPEIVLVSSVTTAPLVTTPEPSSFFLTGAILVLAGGVSRHPDANQTSSKVAWSAWGRALVGRTPWSAADVPRRPVRLSIGSMLCTKSGSWGTRADQAADQGVGPNLLKAVGLKREGIRWEAEGVFREYRRRVLPASHPRGDALKARSLEVYTRPRSRSSPAKCKSCRQ